MAIHYVLQKIVLVIVSGGVAIHSIQIASPRARDL